MLGRTTGAVLEGVDARLIEVEVDLPGGLPGFAAVGLPDSAVREGIDRIRAALPHAGFRLPRRRVIVSLAPAEVRKQGSALDLPIALAILIADEQLGSLPVGDTVFAGELALDGALRPIRGALSVAMAARAAGMRRVVVPRDNAEEAALVRGIAVFGAATLVDAAAVVQEVGRPIEVDAEALLHARSARSPGPDLAEVRGQAAARRALEVAAAGGHHLLLSGPPGAGKTMLARRLPGILPPLSLHEALAVTRVWSAAGLASGLVASRPFRAPHHGISFAGLTGGGMSPTPGEITLASEGVLYLDELTEFRREALEALRQPLEEGRIAVVRVRGRAVFPARFMLIASMNPCPCGYAGQAGARCGCTPREVRKYLGRLSGPLLDRFDLVIDVPPVDPSAMGDPPNGEPSERVRGRVLEARRLQSRRLHGSPDKFNGAMGPAELERYAPLGDRARRLLVEAVRRYRLSARAFDRVRRVARTIADLEGEDAIADRHVAEAVQYRLGLDGAAGLAAEPERP